VRPTGGKTLNKPHQRWAPIWRANPPDVPKYDTEPIWARSSASSQRPGWAWRVVERTPAIHLPVPRSGSAVPPCLMSWRLDRAFRGLLCSLYWVSSPSIDGRVPIRWAGADARAGRLCLARPTGGGSGLAGLTKSISRRLSRPRRTHPTGILEHPANQRPSPPHPTSNRSSQLTRLWSLAHLGDLCLCKTFSTSNTSQRDTTTLGIVLIHAFES